MREKADWAKELNEEIASILWDSKTFAHFVELEKETRFAVGFGYGIFSEQPANRVAGSIPIPVIDLINVDGVWTQPKTSTTEVARVAIKTEFVKVEQENHNHND